MSGVGRVSARQGRKARQPMLRTRSTCRGEGVARVLVTGVESNGPLRSLQGDFGILRPVSNCGGKERLQSGQTWPDCGDASRNPHAWGMRAHRSSQLPAKMPGNKRQSVGVGRGLVRRARRHPRDRPIIRKASLDAIQPRTILRPCRRRRSSSVKSFGRTACSSTSKTIAIVQHRGQSPWLHRRSSSAVSSSTQPHRSHQSRRLGIGLGGDMRDLGRRRLGPRGGD
jgi:hypothetical protein